MGGDVFRTRAMRPAGFLLIGVAVVLMLSCGMYEQSKVASTGDTGSVTFSVNWVTSGEPQNIQKAQSLVAQPLAAIDCTLYGIDQLELEVWRFPEGTSTGVGATKDCSAHAATLSGVPALTPVYVSLTSGDWYGMSSSFTLASGETHDLGVIEVRDTIPSQWQTVEFLDDDRYMSVDPAVAMDDDGNAIAVWYEEGNGIFSRRFSPSGDWGLTRGLVADSASSRTVDTPRIAMDSSGNAIVVWRWYDIGDSEYGLGARRYTPAGEWAGGTWEIASGFAFIRDDHDASGGGHRIVMDGYGNSFVVFEGTTISDSNIYAIRYQASMNSWGSAVPIDDVDGTLAGWPEIAADTDGNAVAVWKEDKSGESDPTIFASVYEASRAAWGTATPIENLAGESEDAEIAMDSSGNAIAVWRFYDYSQTYVYWNRFTPSGGWETEGLLAVSIQGGGIPQIAMDGSGNAVVVWERPDEGNPFNTSLSARSFSAAGNTWQAEGPIENLTGEARTPEVAMGDNGTAIAVWIGSDNYLNVYANLYTVATGSWSTPTRVENIDPEEATNPHIAMNGRGNAVVIWEQGELQNGFKPCANHYD